VADVLKGIKSKTLVVAITSDILFSPSDHDVLVENIPDVRYHLIDSDFGHDGFLVEHKKLNNIILDFLKE
jgi:homoserine O-acetyltransferase